MSTWPIMWAEQNAPRPGDGVDITKSHITLRLGAGARVGQDFVDTPNVSGIANVIGNRDLTLSVQAFGPGARQELEDIRSSLSRPTIQDLLRAGDIVYRDAFPVQNVAALLESSYEERASLDVLFGTHEELTDDLGYIDTVNGSGDLKDATGAVVQSTTFSVTTTP